MDSGGRSGTGSNLLRRLFSVVEVEGALENEITRQIVDAAIHIHRTLGPGLLESAYLHILAHELRKRGLAVRSEVPLPVRWDEIEMDCAFRADLIVEDTVIVELKSVEQTAPVHRKQLLTYLKVANKRIGLLVNFGAPLLKDGITRIVNGLPDSAACERA